MCLQKPCGFQPVRCVEPQGIFWKATAFSKLNIFIPLPKMAIRPAVFQRQAHVFTSTTFTLSTENIWNCRQSFQESRDGDFLCFEFPSTFQQSFSCLCTIPLLSWERGGLSPWLEHGSVWGLCVFRCCGPGNTFGTRSASHNTALSLAGPFWPGVENPSGIYTYLAMQWILFLFPAQISMRAKPGHDVHHC